MLVHSFLVTVLGTKWYKYGARNAEKRYFCFVFTRALIALFTIN